MNKYTNISLIVPAGSNVSRNDSQKLPPVTVVMSTRNRPKSVYEAVKSILESDYPAFKLKVIDQSDDNATQLALKPFMEEPYFDYTYSSSRGLSNGRNLAIQTVDTELIALTDDDCVVPENWLFEMVKAFEADKKIGIVLGNLQPGDYDPTTSYLPTFVIEEPYLIKTADQNFKNKLGWGACMGPRRQAWATVNGFDPLLGAGAPLKSAEDRDFSYRVLSSGFYISFSPRINVIHNGVRKRGQEGRDLAFRDWFGAGAILAKHLKCQNWKMVWVETQLWFEKGVGAFFQQLIKNHRIGGVTPLVSFWFGIALGLITPLDRQAGNYFNNKL